MSADMHNVICKAATTAHLWNAPSRRVVSAVASILVVSRAQGERHIVQECTLAVSMLQALVILPNLAILILVSVVLARADMPAANVAML